MLALLLFGGDTLKDFAFALIVGVASGAYSSVFIAGPVLTHWKEREPVYRARIARILAEHGARARLRGGDRRRAGRRRAAQAPPRARVRRRPDEGVSQEEFDEMVANLGVEAKPAVAPPRAARSGPAGGRRARLQGQPPASRRRRRRRRSRKQAPQHQAREAALMGALVWIMVGLAIWHFTIFLPDRFWGGIVGAFLGATIGGFVFGLLISGFGVPGKRRHRPR